MRSGWIIAALLAAAGCDDARLLTPPPASQPAAMAPATEPSTQAVSTTAPLGNFPLSIEVAPGWGFSGLSGVQILHGQAGEREAQIQLSRRPAMTLEQIRLFATGAERDARQDQSAFVELRQQGELYVLERRSVGEALPATDDEGHPIIDRSPPVHWTFTVFVPQRDSYLACELNFIDLSLRQYESAEGMLRQMIGSIRTARGD